MGLLRDFNAGDASEDVLRVLYWTCNLIYNLVKYSPSIRVYFARENGPNVLASLLSAPFSTKRIYVGFGMGIWPVAEFATESIEFINK